jgi:Ni/Fe-hydrogenase b-type cytochrome subunit
MSAPTQPSLREPSPSVPTATFEWARRLRPPSGDYTWVYLWGRPLRYMHWVAAACVVTLAATGLFIGRPYFVPSGDPLSAYLMGTVRFTHFLAAALLVMTGIVRVYWLFMGNRYEQFRALFPFTRRDMKNLVRMTKFYLMMDRGRAPRYLGHNPLQQLSYTGIYVVGAVMVLTGFAMYGQSNPGGFIYTLFNWVNPLFGGAPIVRFVHHVFTWVFLIFIPLHVYFTLRSDALERTGTISSIISGGRFVSSSEEYIDAEP